ncbi:MAG TPA: tetratricopeptide repeat protein [Anaeromyxobacteraceae bacterium]
MKSRYAALLGLGVGLGAGLGAGKLYFSTTDRLTGAKDPRPAAPLAAPVPEQGRVSDYVLSSGAELQAGRTDEAIQKAEAAVKLEPRNPVAANALGRAEAVRFAATKDPADAARARAAFEQALAVSPAFWPAALNLGELLEQRGDLPGAAAAYQQVLKAEPTHPDRQRLEQVIVQASRSPYPAR